MQLDVRKRKLIKDSLISLDDKRCLIK